MLRNAGFWQDGIVFVTGCAWNLGKLALVMLSVGYALIGVNTECACKNECACKCLKPGNYHC